MAFSRGRRSGGGHDLFWPGYVDVLSTLLLVVTFLLSIFMVAQFYVSQESSGKDTVLRRLQRQIAELTNLLSLEKGQGKTLQDELAALLGHVLAEAVLDGHAQRGVGAGVGQHQADLDLALVGPGEAGGGKGQGGRQGGNGGAAGETFECGFHVCLLLFMGLTRRCRGWRRRRR